MQTVAAYIESAEGDARRVDAEHPLPVTLLPPGSGTTPASATGADGTKTVAATGTPEALAASGTARTLFLFPLSTNTTDVFWGFGTGAGEQHGTIPAVIEPADGKLIDLADIYIRVATNGEGVAYETLN